MTPFRIASVTLCTLFVTTTGSQAQPLPASHFFDDFEDGDEKDGIPVSWLRYVAPYDQGEFGAEGGNLVLRPATSGPTPTSEPEYWEIDVYADRLQFHDVDLHAQVRALSDAATLVGIGALDTQSTDGPSGIGVWGAVAIDGSSNWMTLNYAGGALGNIENINMSHVGQDLNLRLVISGLNVRFSAWPEGTEEPSQPQLRGMLPADRYERSEGHVMLFAGNRTTQVPVAFRYVTAAPGNHVGGHSRIGHWQLEGVPNDVLSELTMGVQPGLLQRWYSIRNPGSYDRVLDRVFDPLSPEDSEQPDVPPFHGFATWWSGDRTAIEGLSGYPTELVGQPRTHSLMDQTWNTPNNNSYTVYLTGEIFIPESGTYKFLDGVDDLAVLGIDLNRDGAVEDDGRELLIHDNSWTNPTREGNDGGLVDDVIPSVEFRNIPVGGDWYTIEAIVAESAGSDSGLFYWDYDASDADGDGIRVGDAAGFPTRAKGEGRVIASDDIPDLLIPDSHLRSTGGKRITGGRVEAELGNGSAYVFELGSGGSHDILEIRRPSDLFTAKLNLNDATIQLAALGELTPGDYDLLQVDQITGQATLRVPDNLAGLLDTSRFLTEGIVTVLGSSRWDCNGDRLVNVLDANCATTATLGDTLAAARLLPGDVNGNGQVEFSDFLTLSVNFGRSAPYTGGDFDKSRDVQFGDFLILAQNFGQSFVAAAAAATVPEPASLTLIGGVLLWLVRFRRLASAGVRRRGPIDFASP